MIWVKGEEEKREFDKVTKGTIGNFLESRIHKSYTDSCDNLYAVGFLTQDLRIGLSSAITDALKAFEAKVKAEYPQIYKTPIPPEVSLELVKHAGKK